MAGVGECTLLVRAINEGGTETFPALFGCVLRACVVVVAVIASTYQTHTHTQTNTHTYTVILWLRDQLLLISEVDSQRVRCKHENTRRRVLIKWRRNIFFFRFFKYDSNLMRVDKLPFEN